MFRIYLPFAAALLLLASYATFAQETPLSPSAAYKQINDARRTGSEDVTALAAALLKRIDPVHLDRGELWSYGNVLQAAGRRDEAKTVMEGVAKDGDLLSRRAYVAMFFFVYENKDIAEFESLRDRYYATFQPSPQNAGNICSVLQSFGAYFHLKGEDERVVAMVKRELDFLGNYDGAYYSYLLPGDLAGAFIDAGKQAECEALIENAIAGFGKKLASLPEGDKSAPAFKRHIDTLTNRLFQIRLIGKPASEVVSMATFNSGPLKLSELKGKVVMLDFWATWCGPCKRAFPGMTKLYAEFKDRGFELLGVTGFQKSFNDNGISEKDLTPERELELTKKFIADHNMTWPIVYSERNCFDPAFGVKGIPTFVLIDRGGIVRVIESGSDNEDLLRMKLDQLLSK